MIAQKGRKEYGIKLHRVLQFVGFLLTGLYAWPLAFRLPHTIRTVYQAYRPGGADVPDEDFWAFSRADAGFRSWYTKIAKDYRIQGRFGYVWDDGLGMPLGVRVYNNLVTYWLLHRLGTRRMLALGFVVMVSFSALLVGWRFNPWIGLAVGLLAAGSPLLVGSYTHMGKPEVFWWGMAIPVVFLGLNGSAFIAGLLWSVTAFSNLSISVMLVLLLGLALLILVPFPNLLALAIGSLPGAMKHGMRGLYMWRAGFLASLAGEQSRLWKRPWYPTADELLWGLPFVASVAASAYVLEQFLVGWVLLLSGIGLYWVNFRMVYLNDSQSFHLAYWVIGLCYAAVAQSLPALFAILVLIYVSPSACGFPVSENVSSQDVNSWQRRLRNVRERMRTYPALMPMSLPRPPKLMRFFSCIPDGARMLAESDGDPRTESRFRAFWQWTEEFLPQRHIDLVNEIYTRTVEAELVDRYLNRFNAEKMSSQEMDSLCRLLGVSYVVAHSPSTMEALESIGFQSVAQVDLATLKEFREIVPTPSETLALLKNPEQVTVIAPTVAWERRGNNLTWDAKAGQTYTVRYRYNVQFCARQENHVLDVEPVKPIAGIPLQFMQVRAAIDGQIMLKFQPRWI